MTDERLQDLMNEAKHSYRLPAEPPLEAIWTRIEREHFDAPARIVAEPWQAPHRGPRRWFAPAVGIAATLLIGIGIGRFSAPVPVETAELPVVREVPVPVASNVAEPLHRATSEYLDETVALLASLRRDSQGVAPSGARFVAQATLLLGTTRLLLDSPAASDPRLRDLLDDLELVLAQVARLRQQPRAEELTFITEAMETRDVVPRLRTVAASFSLSGY